MSKTRGNLVVPGEVYEQYGADTLRGTMLFASPPEDDIDWADVSPAGMHKWLSRVWRLTLEHLSGADSEDATAVERGSEQDVAVLRKATHQRIAAVSEDFEARKYNVAIAKMMELTNALQDATRAGIGGAPVREAIESLLLMLAPVCPFVTEELWSRLGHPGSIHQQPWPVADPALLVEDSLDVVVQVNGKVRGKVTVPADADEDTATAAARADENVARFLDGAEVRKTIYVPGRLVNFVVS